MKYKLNESGSHFVKFTLLSQVWFRHSKTNPGTLVLSEPAASMFDMGLRRTRFQWYGQLTDKVSFYFQHGLNNCNFLAQNPGNWKLAAFFHNALLEYKLKMGSEELIFSG